MKFHEYMTMATACAKLSRAHGYQLTKEEIAESTKGAAFQCPMARTHWVWEQAWLDHGMPYYDVYPSTIDMLTQLDLAKITGDMLKPPGGVNALLVRMPQTEHVMASGEFRVRTIWGHIHNGGTYRGRDTRMLSMGVDYGEADPVGEGSPIFSIRNMPLNGQSIKDMEDVLRTHHSTVVGAPLQHDILRQSLRLIATLCLLDNNPDLIVPQTLAKDADKDVTPALVAKARRRGRHGYSVGAGIEVVPHYRRPHLHTYWTGKGRKVPLVKMIGLEKPIIVHRKKVEAVPTGYLSKKDA